MVLSLVLENKDADERAEFEASLTMGLLEYQAMILDEQAKENRRRLALAQSVGALI